MNVIEGTQLPHEVPKAHKAKPIFKAVGQGTVNSGVPSASDSATSLRNRSQMIQEQMQATAPNPTGRMLQVPEEDVLALQRMAMVGMVGWAIVLAVGGFYGVRYLKSYVAGSSAKVADAAKALKHAKKASAL